MNTAAKLRGAATGEVAPSPIAQFSSFLDKLKPQMAVALPKHMNADRMARLALTAFSTNPDLQGCSAQSIAASIMTAAQLGLEPGINGQGYLIPYKKTCTFVPGWKGLVDLVARSGRATVWTGAVYPGDKFEYQLGDTPFCRHVPGDDGDEKPFTHVYAVGRVRDASMPVIEVWTREKVRKHLKRYNKVGDRHYAHTNENNFEMYARKVALLQVLKYMPASIELANAIEVSHAAEDGRGVVLEGDFVHFTGSEDPPDGAGSPAGDGSGSNGGVSASFDYAAAKKRIEGSTDPEGLAVYIDELSSTLPDGDAKAELMAAYRTRIGALQGG
jgi:recombination protein RecT